MRSWHINGLHMEKHAVVEKTIREALKAESVRMRPGYWQGTTYIVEVEVE